MAKVKRLLRSRAKRRASLVPPPTKGPKVLLFDIETAPIVADIWSIWQQGVGLNQIAKDWHLMSWAAKWLGDPATKVMYRDQRAAADFEDDRGLLKDLWTLLDQADIVVTQNGRSFDQKKVQARFLMHGMQPPSSYKHIDTKLLAKKHFAFTSNRLEYMTDKLNKKYKKQKHRKYPGHEMWTECRAGNQDAWRHMERYNKWDVLSLEELYRKLIPWDDRINFALYSADVTKPVCKCGSEEFKRNGIYYAEAGRYQKWKCLECGAETRDKYNMLDKSEKKSLRVGTPRS